MMKKRDLKADLEELESLKEDDVHFMSIVCFIENNAEKWLEQGVVELERAIKAEKQLEDLLAWEEPKEKCYLSAMRSIAELESLVRELVAALQGVSGMLDYATGECRCGVCEYCNVQKRADKALAKAKEVLGDE